MTCTIETLLDRARCPFLVWAILGAGPLFASPSDISCAPGAYRSPSGELAAVVRVPPALHYTLLRGPRGDFAAEDSPLECEKGEIRSRNGEAWSRLEFKSTEIDFHSHGTRLHGVLLQPQALSTKAPLVVLVHGSERTSPNGSSYQQLFTAQGVATFAYDKRGTARSQGVYTQDFMLLADDAAAAVQAARRACRGCFSRVGLHGGSQGGWIAPRAALESKADFVEVSFGVFGTPLEQDQWQVDYQLRELGFAPDVAVHAVTDATAKVAASDFTEGFEALDDIRRRYGSEPWFPKLDGQYTGELTRGEIDRARVESPAVPWRYDSIAVVRKLKIPQLWVFAQEDATAPSAPSISRLEALRAQGMDATIVVFPHTDHGISTFVTEAPGQRHRTGLADGYLRLIADWSKGIFRPPYGDAMTFDRPQTSGTAP
jgi:uncharacterized protein